MSGRVVTSSRAVPIEEQSYRALCAALDVLQTETKRRTRLECLNSCMNASPLQKWHRRVRRRQRL